MLVKLRLVKLIKPKTILVINIRKCCEIKRTDTETITNRSKIDSFYGHSSEIEMEHGNQDHGKDSEEVSARVIDALGDKPTRPMHRP